MWGCFSPFLLSLGKTRSILHQTMGASSTLQSLCTCCHGRQSFLNNHLSAHIIFKVKVPDQFPTKVLTQVIFPPRPAIVYVKSTVKVWIHDNRKNKSNLVQHQTIIKKKHGFLKILIILYCRKMDGLGNHMRRTQSQGYICSRHTKKNANNQSKITFSKPGHQLQAASSAKVNASPLQLITIQEGACCRCISAFGDMTHFHWSAGQLKPIQLF